MSKFRYWLATHTRAIFWWLSLIGLGVGLFLIFGCANTPVPRATDTPAYQLSEGQTVVVMVKSREQIAEYARKNLDTAYKVEAAAFPGPTCTVWMPDGPVNLYLLNHELAHCAGLTHDRNGEWK